MIREPLALASDIVCVPLAELPENLRAAIPAQGDEYVLTRPGSRDRTKVIGPAAARFLELFRTPTTILDAVLRHGSASGTPAAQLLGESFPLLRSLVNCGWLAKPGPAAAAVLRPVLETGARFAGWDVLDCVQVLEDTEVHQARDRGGRIAALKVWRTGRACNGEGAAREVAILEHLGGTVSPRLFDSGEADGHEFLAAEWVDGEHAVAAADRLRGEGREQLLALAVNIAAAYARLHARNVLHGDVHPRNVLVAADGSVRLVDFGLARSSEGGSGWCRAPRGGIAFFAEPELAGCRSRGERPPQTTPAGEQYSLAALLYSLFTARHYADFSLDKQTQYRQVMEDPPVPFSRRGLVPWPAVEECLGRALRKDPAERFATVAAFAAALANIASERPGLPRPYRVGDGRGKPGRSPIEELRDRLTSGGAGLWRGPIAAPRASVKYGAAGIAYALYRMSCLEDSAELLAIADGWSAEAVRAIDRPDGFANPALGIGPGTVGNVSLYHSPTGVFVVQALIAHARGDVVTWNAAVARFVEHASAPSPHLDLALGRAGVLLAAALLREAVPTDAALAAFGTRIRDELWGEVSAFGPIREEPRVKYLGIAHGWAGTLYAVLRWDRLAGRASAGVAERLDQLAAFAEPAGPGRGVRWPRFPRGGRRAADFLPGWCHGTAGHVFLWALAHRASGEERYATLAAGAAENTHVDADGMTNLCCGLAGRAYSLLHWYKHTGEAKWLAAARNLGATAATRPPDGTFSDVSLYKGRLGVALVGTDLNHPEWSSLPMFEGAGWPG